MSPKNEIDVLNTVGSGNAWYIFLYVFDLSMLCRRRLFSFPSNRVSNFLPFYIILFCCGICSGIRHWAFWMLSYGGDLCWNVDLSCPSCWNLVPWREKSAKHASDGETSGHTVTPPLFFSMWTRKMYKGNTAIISYNVITTSKGRSSHHMCLSYLVMAVCHDLSIDASRGPRELVQNWISFAISESSNYLKNNDSIASMFCLSRCW